MLLSNMSPYNIIWGMIVALITTCWIIDLKHSARGMCAYFLNCSLCDNLRVSSYMSYSVLEDIHMSMVLVCH